MPEANPMTGLCINCDFRDTIYDLTPEKGQFTHGSNLVNGVEDLLSSHFTRPAGRRDVMVDLREHLEANPCDLVKTGQCGAAVFLIARSLGGA